jgi:hypothetical protein
MHATPVVLMRLEKTSVLAIHYHAQEGMLRSEMDSTVIRTWRDLERLGEHLVLT